MKQILANVLKGLKQIGQETIEKSGEEATKVADSVITGKALLGDITTMSETEYAQKKKYEENKDQSELTKIREGVKEMGRNVQGEMNQIYQEKKNKEEEDERKFLENLKRQREEERAQVEAAGVDVISTNPAKQKKSRGSALAKGKKKGTPDLQQMSQTAEVKSKVD